MAEAFKKIVQGYFPATGGTRLLYEVPASTELIIKSINITNGSAANAEVTLYMTADGDTADDEQIILPGVDIVAGGFAEWEGTMCMEAATEIHGWSETGGEVTFTVTGVLITA